MKGDDKENIFLGCAWKEVNWMTKRGGECGGSGILNIVKGERDEGILMVASVLRSDE